MTPEEMQNQQPAAEAAQEQGPNPAVTKIIEMIAQLDTKEQRDLMWFLNEELNSTSKEEDEEVKKSPEEQTRKADAMADMF